MSPSLGGFKLVKRLKDLFTLHVINDSDKTNIANSFIQSEDEAKKFFDYYSTHEDFSTGATGLSPEQQEQIKQKIDQIKEEAKEKLHNRAEKFKGLLVRKAEVGEHFLSLSLGNDFDGYIDESVLEKAFIDEKIMEKVKEKVKQRFKDEYNQSREPFF